MLNIVGASVSKLNCFYLGISSNKTSLRACDGNSNSRIITRYRFYRNATKSARGTRARGARHFIKVLRPVENGNYMQRSFRCSVLTKFPDYPVSVSPVKFGQPVGKQSGTRNAAPSPVSRLTRRSGTSRRAYGLRVFDRTGR